MKATPNNKMNNIYSILPVCVKKMLWPIGLIQSQLPLKLESAKCPSVLSKVGLQFQSFVDWVNGVKVL